MHYKEFRFKEGSNIYMYYKEFRFKEDTIIEIRILYLKLCFVLRNIFI